MDIKFNLRVESSPLDANFKIGPSQENSRLRDYAGRATALATATYRCGAT